MSHPIQSPITGTLTTLLSTTYEKAFKLCKTGLLPRLVLWLLVFAFFPLSVTAARLSFRIEVLGRIPDAALSPAERAMTLAERVLLRLESAEQKEPDVWLRDDIRIAWITVLEASRGNRQPFVHATYAVLGIHPSKVWSAIVARRKALLGSEYSLFYPDDIPQTKKQPMAKSRGGNAPQKTCAYGAQEAVSDLTGASCSTATKREARRALTSEFGLNDAPPAGVAAPAKIVRRKAAAA